MARVHPSFPTFGFTSAGAYRERDVLRQLADDLSDGYDLFHNVEWSDIWNGQQSYGEVDIIAVAPSGHILLIEVKAGNLLEEDGQFFKVYQGQKKLVDLQVKRQFGAIVRKLKHEEMSQVQVGHLLVLPDHHVQSGGVGFPRQAILDASEMSQLAERVQAGIPSTPLSSAERQRVMAFLGNALAVQVDVATRIGQARHESQRLASGLATWVPKVQHSGGTFVINATAGSGKTQLALQLLNDARDANQRAAYFCYNRPLADHMISVAPPQAEVMTFHEKTREVYTQANGEPDFADTGIFDAMTEHFMTAVSGMLPRWDLLIVDESQDFEGGWIEALVSLAKADGRVYIMGDEAQRIYKREPFNIENAVQITCMDNFRTPRQIVEDINRFGLTPEPIVARSPWEGQGASLHTYDSDKDDGLTYVEVAVKALLEEGFKPNDIVVLSYHGHARSTVLKQDTIAGLRVRKFTGKHDDAHMPIWTEGELLVESVYRFKGQSAPAVVFCEIELDELDARATAKMFVGMTRAQLRLDLVASSGFMG